MIITYRRAIEELFGNLKTRGFDLEATHMTHPEKMAKLMGISTLTVLWCFISGYWKYEETRQLPLNKHD